MSSTAGNKQGDSSGGKEGRPIYQRRSRISYFVGRRSYITSSQSVYSHSFFPLLSGSCPPLCFNCKFPTVSAVLGYVLLQRFANNSPTATVMETQDRPPSARNGAPTNNDNNMPVYVFRCFCEFDGIEADDKATAASGAEAA